MEASDADVIEQEAELLCGHCRYNLRGVPSDRCPECGRQFDPNHLVFNLIPWEQRKYIGRIRALVWTVWMVSFQPRRLAAKMDWPVSRSAARWFHVLVVFMAAAAVYTIPVSALNIWPRLFQLTQPYESTERLAFVFNSESFIVSATAVAISLALATALVSCFARNRALPVERQNRALAVSHYACAPLFFFALVLLGVWGITAMLSPQSTFQPTDVALLLSQLAGLTVSVSAVVWLLRRSRHGAKPHPPIHPAAGIFSITLGAIGIALAWSKWPAYINDITPPAAGMLSIIGGVALMTPLVWWWLISVRLLALACDYTRAQAIRIGLALLLTWTSVLIVVLITAHAIYVVVTMALA